MTTCRNNLSAESRRGVAMVIVLGLIAVLMMMAVAFSIHMRIERTGAGNYKHGVVARHMIWSGLANAVVDIDEAMYSNGPNQPPDMWPEWTVLASTVTGTSDRASVLSKIAAEFIPDTLRDQALASDPKWRWITDSSGFSRGRYAFVVLNTSGLLDANKVGRTARGDGSGTNTFAIQLAGVDGVDDAGQFRYEALIDERYETFPEIVYANEHVGDGRAFAAFSLAPLNDVFDEDGVVKDRAYIGPDLTKWDANKIIAAFRDCHVLNPELAYTNLLDYVDDDCIPRMLDAGDVEAVPMINEFELVYLITFDAGGVISGNAGTIVEWVYPFMTNSARAFTMHYDIEVTTNGGHTATGAAPTALDGSFSSANFTGGNAVPMEFGQVTKSTAFSGSSTNAAVNLNFDVMISAYVEGPGGVPVDAVPAPYDKDKGLEFKVRATVARGQTMMITNVWECLDPRFNWVTDGSKAQWFHSDMLKGAPGYDAAAGRGAENFVTKIYFDPMAYGASSDDYDLDDDMWMHVADRPLTRVGELGNICYDWWRTIRLYKHTGVKTPHPEAPSGGVYHPVLDHFRLSDDTYARGLVNVNTTNKSVLAAVFKDMPEDEYQGLNPKTLADAQAIATNIIGGGPYTNVSEIGLLSDTWINYATGTREIDKEAGIRNSADLLTTRQNLFTVIMRAEAFSEGLGGLKNKGSTLASSQAIAELWRDPVPDTNGNHRVLVRYFKYLED